MRISLLKGDLLRHIIIHQIVRAISHGRLVSDQEAVFYICPGIAGNPDSDGFVGLRGKNFPVTETYTEIEYKSEYRTKTRTEVQKEIIRSGEDVVNAYGWYNMGTTSGKEGSICVNQPFWYFCYSIPVRSITSIGITSNSQFPQITACDMERIEEFGRTTTEDPFEQEVRYCDWLDAFNNKVSNSRLIGKYSTGSDRQLLKIDTSGARWLSIIIQGNAGGESSTFTTAILKWADTRDNEVQKDQTVEVKVPVTVEKQRTVTSTRMVPFWEAMFK